MNVHGYGESFYQFNKSISYDVVGSVGIVAMQTNQ